MKFSTKRVSDPLEWFGCPCNRTIYRREQNMLERFLDAFIYYSALSIGIVVLISAISIVFGGRFAGVLFVIISGMALLAFLDFSLYGIVCLCLIINILLFLLRRLCNNSSYTGEWRDKSGCYLLNIKETDEEIFVETNFLNDFDIKLSKRSINLNSATKSCIIKKNFSNKLKLTLGSKTLIMHRIDCHKVDNGAPAIVTAKQQALLGLVLGVSFAAVQAIIQVESNHLLFFEALLGDMVTYAIYGFGYVFSLTFFVFLSELMYNITDTVISISPSVKLLTIFIAITLIFVVLGLAFIPGIYIGIKAILDEIA